MEFFAHHGCFDEERKIGNRFIVNVSVYDEERFEIVKKAEDYIEFQKEYCCVEEKAVPYDFGKVLIDGYLENKKKCT
jgi:dihydroneopterin aldolase